VALPKLAIICGLSFAGKSTLGQALSRQFGYVEVDADCTKMKLYGATAKDRDLTAAQWKTIYERTDKEIETLLKSGRSVVDASRNFRKAERNQVRLLARKLQADFITIYVDTPGSVARERCLENRRMQKRRDVTDDDFQEVIAVMEPPAVDEAPLVFHFADDIERWISGHRNVLSIDE
jgi:predicted kinase